MYRVYSSSTSHLFDDYEIFGDAKSSCYRLALEQAILTFGKGDLRIETIEIWCNGDDPEKFPNGNWQVGACPVDDPHNGAFWPQIKWEPRRKK